MRINNLSKWFQTNPLQTKILELIMDAGIFVMFLHDIITALISEGETEEDISQALTDLTAKGIIVHCDYSNGLTTIFLSRDAMDYLCMIQEEPDNTAPFKRKSKMTISGSLEQHVDDEGYTISSCSLFSTLAFKKFGILGEMDINVTVTGDDNMAIAKAQEEFFKYLSNDVCRDDIDFDIVEINSD